LGIKNMHLQLTKLKIKPGSSREDFLDLTEQMIE
jgi:hypothetical protein